MTELSSIKPTSTTFGEHKEIIELLFPDFDLTDVLLEYSHLSNDALVNLILEKSHQIPRKPKNQGICCRIRMKVREFYNILSSPLPYIFGRHRPLAIEHQPKNYGLKETLICCVCWEIAPVEEIGFCDPLYAKPGNLNAEGTKETHIFCRSCLEQHALAAAEEMPLAKGGLGLNCMMPGCENPITFHEISAFISPEMIKKLQERAAELCVIQAALNYLERCHKCNCAVELGRSPKQMQVFDCPECKAKFCRLCDEEWRDEHKGVSCEVFGRQNSQARLLEKRLSEIVVRKCPKCKMAFIKYDGCNKVTCKCGQTQCYICRTNDIKYDHFCTCPFAKKRNLQGKFHCEKCGKGCLLWESSVPIEQHEMERIRAEVREQEAKKAAKAAGTKMKKEQKQNQGQGQGTSSGILGLRRK